MIKNAVKIIRNVLNNLIIYRLLWGGWGENFLENFFENNHHPKNQKYFGKSLLNFSPLTPNSPIKM